MKNFLLLCCALYTASLAQAEGLSEVPVNWQVENYGTGGIVVWYTASVCRRGQLILPLGSSISENSRLSSAILEAKQSGRKLFVTYSVVSNICTITNFETNK